MNIGIDGLMRENALCPMDRWCQQCQMKWRLDMSVQIASCKKADPQSSSLCSDSQYVFVYGRCMQEISL